MGQAVEGVRRTQVVPITAGRTGGVVVSPRGKPDLQSGWAQKKALEWAERHS